MRQHPMPLIVHAPKPFRLVLALLSLTCAAWADSGMSRSFNVPAGLAALTLKQFSEQAERELMFPAESVSAVRTKAVRGSMTPREALDRMLAATGLTVIQDPTTKALVIRQTSALTAQATASQPTNPEFSDKAMNFPSNRNIIRRWLSALLALNATLSASAQTTTPSTPSKEEEVIELSPFEVVADTKGYYSANTMSGTRLNSPLEDLGASISVITKQQMEDLALLDINDVFLYMGSTEGTGQYTEIGETSGRQDITDATAGDPTNANRIRGIGKANVSRGNFETSNRVPLDPLDSDGVEISRGPNASIFGLGNPSGTINIIGATANLQRDRSTVAFRADSFDGWRSSLDLNRVLIRDRLALRASGVKEHTGFDLKPSGVDTERFNAMLAFMPFKKTMIRASYQYYHAEGNRANSIPPQDGLGAWRAAGSQTWDPLTNSLHDATGAVTRTSPPTYTYRPTSNYGVQYVDREGITYWGQFYGATGGTSPYGTPFNRLGTRQTNRGIVVTVPAFQDTQPLIGRRTSVITDQSVYDWKSMNLYSQNFFEDKTETSRVTLDQIFIDTPRQTLAAQAGWFHEDSERFTRYIMADGATQGLTGILSVDINERRLDGTPNPNFLRPFIFQAEPRIRSMPLRNDTYRFQAAYKLDFSKDGGWSKWLGSHSLVGYGEYKGQDRKNYFYREDIISRNSWQFPNATSNYTAGQPVREFLLFYVGDNQGQNMEYAPGPVDYGDYTYTYGDANTGVFQNESITLGLAPLNHNGTNVIQKTKGALLQSHLWRGRIVTTIGKREDEHYTKQYNRGGSTASVTDRGFSFNLDYLDQFQNIETQFRKGSAIQKGVVVKPFRGWNFIDRPAAQGTGLTRFFAQTLRGLNVHYNKSDNFLPAAPAQNVFQQDLPDPRGDGKDYGFSLNLFDGKLYLKVNKYSTETLDSRNGPSNAIARAALALDFTGIAGGVEYSLEAKTREWITAANPGISEADLIAQQTAIMGITPKDRLEFSGITVTETDDIVSRGHEIELHYNPVNYWTLTANFTEQQTINTRMGTNVAAYVQQRLPYWTTIVDPTNGVLWFDNK